MCRRVQNISRLTWLLLLFYNFIHFSGIDSLSCFVDVVSAGMVSQSFERPCCGSVYCWRGDIIPLLSAGEALLEVRHVNGNVYVLWFMLVTVD